MDVPVTELRRNLRHWLAVAGAGEEVTVTDRGTPVARLLGVDAAPVLDRLTAEGLVARPERSDRPKAGGRVRPRARRPVSDRVSDQRR